MFFVQADPTLEELVQDTIQRCGLPVKLDAQTPGDGNCWVWAVAQQLERPELRGQLNGRTSEALGARGKNYLNLKKSIARFATTTKHPTILALKEEFESEGQVV